MEKQPSLFKRYFNVIKAFFKRVWQLTAPGPRAIRGAGWGILASAGLVYLAFILWASAGPLVPQLITLAVMLAMGLLLLFAGQGVAWAVGVLAKIPWDMRWTIPAGVGLLFLALMSVPEKGATLTLVLLLAAGALVGAGIGSLIRGGWAGLSKIQRGLAIAGLVIGLAALGAGGWWYAWRGPAAQVIPNAAGESGAPLKNVTLPDPSQPGPYPVLTLTYGAGTDLHRPEFGQDVTLKTYPVDGSKFLEDSWKGFSGDLRKRWWGFGPDNLPLNGRVWYPDGEGPFPLVLIVHGNHTMADFSDPGYAYLGELLASRGFIFVSVDQNFINGGAVDMMDGFSNENDARGWLLLEHLRVWKTWENAEANPFFGKVDMNNIAVMGHSRGGEAAAVAAAFNRLPYYPDNAAQAFSYNFNIKAVAAIAPIDGQYVPAWKPVQLENVNYFVLHGSHDSDVSSFDGINVLERLKFTDGGDWFKSGLYVYRANHGQFNSSWGDDDRGGLAGGFLGKGALLSQAEQEQVAKVYLSAFLEATLHGQAGYLPLFADWRAAGKGWLPDTIYVNRFDRAGDRLAATFEEDVDLQTATLPGARTEAMNFNHWREQKLHSKWAGGDTSAVYLKWNEDGQAVYTVRLPDDGFAVGANDALIFNLADANQDPAPGEAAKAAEESEENGEEKPADGARQPIDLTIELVDAAGRVAQLPLSQYSLLQPQTPARLFKHDLFEQGASSEPVLQSYALPLADFRAANPEFDPTRLRAIKFIFNRTPRGSVILDNVGVREAE